MTQFIATICRNFLELIGTFFSLLLTRWLMELSTPQEDIAWLMSQDWYWSIQRLRWYRGTEYHHQLAFARIAERESR